MRLTPLFEAVRTFIPRSVPRCVNAVARNSQFTRTLSIPATANWTPVSTRLASSFARLTPRSAPSTPLISAHFNKLTLQQPFRGQLARLATAAGESDGASGSSSSSGSSQAPPPRIVGYWLLANAALVYGIVVLGGVTRLTESGLSITEWNVIRGMKWPSSEEEWNEEWRKYKETPEYKVLNHSMTLHEFKSIFFYEWAHRNWGRFIGAFFLIPAGYFFARGMLPGKTKWRILEIGALIGFQGALGWYMVKSGLDEQHLENRPISTPRVSQYRLASHLGVAFLVYAASILEGLKVLRANQAPEAIKAMTQALSNPKLTSFAKYSKATALLTFITVISGAFVAGLDAGLVYNEWPMMGEGLVPSDMFGLTEVAKNEGREYPIWKNFLENPSTVQFDHRILAYTTLTTVTALWLYSRRLPLPRNVRIAANTLVAVAYLQATLGITTLLYLVPVELASAHQAGSMALWTVALYLAQAMRKMPVK